MMGGGGFEPAATPPLALHLHLRQLCIERGETMTVAAERAVRLLLRRYKKKCGHVAFSHLPPITGRLPRKKPRPGDSSVGQSFLNFVTLEKAPVILDAVVADLGAMEKQTKKRAGTS